MARRPRLFCCRDEQKVDRFLNVLSSRNVHESAVLEKCRVQGREGTVLTGRDSAEMPFEQVRIFQQCSRKILGGYPLFCGGRGQLMIEVSVDENEPGGFKLGKDKLGNCFRGQPVMRTLENGIKW